MKTKTKYKTCPDKIYKTCIMLQLKNITYVKS